MFHLTKIEQLNNLIKVMMKSNKKDKNNSLYKKIIWQEIKIIVKIKKNKKII